MDLSTFRQYFPISITDIYMNHAAVSPFSTKVTSAIEQIIQMRSIGKIEVFPEFLEEKKCLKENISKLIKASPDNIAVITNTSEGLNWLVKELKWQAGDRILLVKDEFPANIYPFLNMEEKDVLVDFVPLKNGFVDLEDLLKSIRPETKLLSISFVEFLNGYRNDLNSIGRICRQNDIIFSVDGIQGVGAIPIDVQNFSIDFLSNGGHKWLMGPQGCGFMYIAPSLFERLQPAFVGWLSVKDSWDFLDYHLDFLQDGGRFEIGTANVLGIYKKIIFIYL